MLSANGKTQGTNRISDDRRWFALGAVLVTMFFSALDQTVVSTAMPVIIGNLKGFSIYAWVFTAYMMASTISVPIYGKLSDVYGRKPFYIIGLGLFIIGSALSGQAHSMMELIIFRAFQGIGGGAMLSMPRATIGDIFNPRERGRWMGVIAMTFGLASIVGPFLGGWITDHWGWRWIFYINLPVAAAALVTILYALPRVRVEKRVHIDWAGSVLLVLGLMPLLLALTWAGTRYEWGSPIIIGLLSFAVATLLCFVWAERRVPEPIIPVEFFRVRVFTTANLVGFLITIAMFGTLMFLPIYIQGVLGMSAQNSGAVMTPMMLSFIVGSLVAGQLMTRTGRYKLLTIVAAGIMSVGLFLMTRLGINSTWGTVVRDMLVTGVGIGALMPTLNVAVQNAFPYEVMGVVNASQQFVRSLGGAIAAPILGTVLATTFSAQLRPNIPQVLQQAIAGLPSAQQKLFLDPQTLINAQAQAAMKSEFAAFGAQANEMYQSFITAVHQALASGIGELFLIGLAVALAALAASLLLPEISLKHDEFYETATASEGASAAKASEPPAAPASARFEQRASTRARLDGWRSRWRAKPAPESASGSDSGSGGTATGVMGGSPAQPSRRRISWIMACTAIALVLALLGLTIQVLLAQNALKHDIAALQTETRALAEKQADSLEALQAEVAGTKSAGSQQTESPAPETGQVTSASSSQEIETLQTTVVGSGTVLPDHGNYSYRTVVSLVATPDVGWRFIGWSGDATGSASPTDITMDENKSITATFAVDTCELTASTSADGSISPSGTVTVDYGSSQTFTIAPIPHYHVADVLVDGTSVGAVSGYAFANVTASHSIKAIFAVDQKKLTTSVVGKGAVSPDHGDYSYEAVVSITATPDIGWRFVGWGGDASGAANPITVTMDDDKEISATFAAATGKITATADGNGSIRPSGETLVPYGASRTFIITPFAHYHVTDVTVDGSSVGAVSSYTFSGVEADHTIKASFSPDE